MFLMVMDLEFRLELLHELRKKRKIIFFLFKFVIVLLIFTLA